MMASQRPNILWITFEDTSPRFGCYGDPVAKTPNVDKLASQGCLWKNAFSTAPTCAPSRCSVITGDYATATGGIHQRSFRSSGSMDFPVEPYNIRLPHYMKTVSYYLRANGYYTCNCGKTDYQFWPTPALWDDCQEGPNAKAHWRNRPRLGSVLLRSLQSDADP